MTDFCNHFDLPFEELQAEERYFSSGTEKFPRTSASFTSLKSNFSSELKQSFLQKFLPHKIRRQTCRRRPPFLGSPESRRRWSVNRCCRRAQMAKHCIWEKRARYTVRSEASWVKSLQLPPIVRRFSVSSRCSSCSWVYCGWMHIVGEPLHEWLKRRSAKGPWFHVTLKGLCGSAGSNLLWSSGSNRGLGGVSCSLAIDWGWPHERRHDVAPVTGLPVQNLRTSWVLHTWDGQAVVGVQTM